MKTSTRRARALGAPLLLALPALALAQDTPTLDSGDTAWMLTATALVLFMTIPGRRALLRRHGALEERAVGADAVLRDHRDGHRAVDRVRLQHGLRHHRHGEGSSANLNSFVGGLSRAFLAGLGVDSLVYRIPESVFVMFQMTFAIITPALIVGAFAERMKFSAMMLFMALWVTVCIPADRAHGLER
jgi:Amt family ammonium transporter